MLYGILEEVREAKASGLSREEAQEKIHYIDRPGFSRPEYMAERMKLLEGVGIGNIYDQLGDHPAS